MRELVDEVLEGHVRTSLPDVEESESEGGAADER